MTRAKTPAPAIDATIGYAADERGSGVAYVRAVSGDGEQLLRVPFRLARVTAMEGRDVGYAALTAVAGALRRWGAGRSRLILEDARLVADLESYGELPAPIVLPYVRARCALNALDARAIELGPESDLTQRARAEVALRVAA